MTEEECRVGVCGSGGGGGVLDVGSDHLPEGFGPSHPPRLKTKD